MAGDAIEVFFPGGPVPPASNGMDHVGVTTPDWTNGSIADEATYKSPVPGASATLVADAPGTGDLYLSLIHI